ncbi:MAG: hypothetical protein B7Z73_17740 [Planctomycetia bacterium 21-64-5]|nr:MAG: hypothetical protein B7Z73_17740 [Planctomycetia bacterium 21-64-5]
MSFRPGSLHFGLTFSPRQWPWALVSLSPFDLSNLSQGGVSWQESALVLSRVYVFPEAPKNAISFALAKLRRWLAINRSEITTLITYCNPNLGFTGASYEADNWRLFGYEHCTRYAYMHGNYVTDRRIAELFGKAPELLSRDELTFSVWRLQPLRLYIRNVRGRAEVRHAEPCHFERWMPSLPT